MNLRVKSRKLPRVHVTPPSQHRFSDDRIYPDTPHVSVTPHVGVNGEKKETLEKSGRSLGVEMRSRNHYAPTLQGYATIGGRTWEPSGKRGGNMRTAGK
jgi:hypothetical protein